VRKPCTADRSGFARRSIGTGDYRKAAPAVPDETSTVFGRYDTFALSGSWAQLHEAIARRNGRLRRRHGALQMFDLLRRCFLRAFALRIVIAAEKELAPSAWPQLHWTIAFGTTDIRGRIDRHRFLRRRNCSFRF